MPCSISRLLLVLLVCLSLAASLACDQRDTGDVGPVTKLRIGNPTFKQINGAEIYLYRGEEGPPLALWGISPLADTKTNAVHCFVVRRNNDSFHGVAAPFFDPCRGAWWTRDGRFLGYSADEPGAAPDGPDLVHLPYTVQNGRMIIDLEALRCIQNRERNCAVAVS